MKHEEDPRVRVARRVFAMSWAFFTVFVAVMLGTALSVGNEPRLLGMPRWAAWACLVVPTVFVAALIPLVERLIPDVPLSDDSEDLP